VRVIERQGSREDEHFTEGEPDLEPPEELAVLEVDEEALFEEDLDNRVDLEDEVDEDVLETSLDHLVHDGDGDEEEDEEDDNRADAVGRGSAVSIVALVVGDATDVEDLEVEDLEDKEESLDRILREKLAGDEPADDPDEGDPDEGEDLVTVATTAPNPMVPTCGPHEFVCRCCFLVLSRAQRADSSETTCRDCASYGGG
jgi:hypothetical protein